MYTDGNVNSKSLDQVLYDLGLRKFMLQVFNYMTLALAISGLVALGVSMSPAATALIWGTPLKWVAIFAPLGMSLAFMFMINKISSTSAMYFLFAFAAVMGISLSSIFIIYKLGSIAQVFFITSATFGSASLYGYTTKKDLTSMGSFLMMGVLGLVIASVVNIFLASSVLTFIVSILAVLIFTGLTAYDTQELKSVFDETTGEEQEKAGIIGALNLYLNFINIFVALMQLIGEKK
jgi:FtsH-binding integral membrane protein